MTIDEELEQAHSAAYSANSAAYSAAYSANSAAYSAVWSARSASWSAYSAAERLKQVEMIKEML